MIIWWRRWTDEAKYVTLIGDIDGIGRIDDCWGEGGINMTRRVLGLANLDQPRADGSHASHGRTSHIRTGRRPTVDNSGNVV